MRAAVREAVREAGSFAVTCPDGRPRSRLLWRSEDYCGAADEVHRPRLPSETPPRRRRRRRHRTGDKRRRHATREHAQETPPQDGRDGTGRQRTVPDKGTESSSCCSVGHECGTASRCSCGQEFGSREPGAGSREPGAGSREPGGQSDGPNSRKTSCIYGREGGRRGV